MSDVIEARLRVAYPGFSLDTELRLPGRGVTALFGASGSGKTTWLRCVAGLERGCRGVLQVGGETWQDDGRGLFVPAHRRPLGYVFQDARLFEHLDVRGNLLYGFKRVAAAQRRVGLEQAVELLGLGALLERRPARLSGGERQRVGIARALLSAPRVLLMDEPLAALDHRRKQDILPYLERLHDELDIPVLYVSHAPDEVARLADHLVVLEAGRVIASGPLQDTLARLDLSLALDADAGVVVEGRAGAHDADYGLLRLELPGALHLKVAHDAMAPGRPLRCRVLARDVSLSLEEPRDTSILNRLPVRVVDEAPAEQPAHVLVRLDAAGTPLLARVTRYSRDRLEVHPGKTLWAQVKAVAVLA